MTPGLTIRVDRFDQVQYVDVTYPASAVPTGPDQDSVYLVTSTPTTP